MVIATTDSARPDCHVKTDALSGAVSKFSASNPTAGGRVIADNSHSSRRDGFDTLTLKTFAVKRELERWGVRSTAKRVKIRDLYTVMIRPIM